MPEDELEGLLRRIRERTARRPGWSRWRVPTLALAGAAAVVAALVAAPSLLPTLRPSDQVAGRSAGAAQPGGPTPVPGAGVNDVTTVWPYGSRAEGFRQAAADQAARTYGDLTKPDQVAVRFVGSYLGRSGLDALSLGAYQAGLRMQVNLDGHPISLVYLVRVRVGDDAPYVVVDAQSPDLTLDPVPSVPSDGLLTAAGTVRTQIPPEVQLRAPGDDVVLADTGRNAAVRGTAWSARMRLPDGARAAAMTAWTVGSDGTVVAFASRPLG